MQFSEYLQWDRMARFSSHPVCMYCFCRHNHHHHQDRYSWHDTHRGKFQSLVECVADWHSVDSSQLTESLHPAPCISNARLSHRDEVGAETHCVTLHPVASASASVAVLVGIYLFSLSKLLVGWQEKKRIWPVKYCISNPQRVFKRFQHGKPQLMEKLTAKKCSTGVCVCVGGCINWYSTRYTTVLMLLVILLYHPIFSWH